MTFTRKILSVKKDFDMSSTSSCVFHHSQWEDCVAEEEHTSIPYLLYRIIFMLILISSITFSTLCQSYLFQIFLTNWSFTLQTLYSVLFAFNIIWAKRDFLLRTLHLRLYSQSRRSNSNLNSNVKSYELKEGHSWDGNSVDVADNENRKDMMTCVNINVDSDGAELDDLDGETDKANTAVPKAVVGDVENRRNANNNNLKSHTTTAEEEGKAGGPSILEKFIWILMNVSHVLPHVVALGYWVFVYKYDPDQPSCERFRSHFIVHGACSLLALIDSLVVAVPVRKTHFVFPSFVLLVYCVFSYIYELAGGPYRNGKEYIYSILNWRYKPGRTVILVTLGLIVSPLIHLALCWGVHFIRVKLVKWRNDKRRNK